MKTEKFKPPTVKRPEPSRSEIIRMISLHERFAVLMPHNAARHNEALISLKQLLEGDSK